MLAIEKIAFTIGNIEVRWYGIIIATGALLAALLATRVARLRGEDPDHIWQVFPWALIGGIIGARLGFFVSDPSAWRGLESINPLSGGFQGLSIQGAVVGGIIAGFIYTRLAKFSLFRLMDIAAPGLALAQGIGRLGNFVNQEAYGAPCDDTNPLCVVIDPENRRPGYEQNSRFQPTFAYEMVLNFINALIVFWLNLPKQQQRFALRDGDVFWVYAIIYSIGRFIIESVRIDSSMAGGAKVPQLFAIATIVVAIAFIIYNHRTRRSNTETAAKADGGETEAAGDALIPASAIAATVNRTAQRNVRFTSAAKAQVNTNGAMLGSNTAEDDADIATTVSDDNVPTDAVAAASDAAQAHSEHEQETAAAAVAWTEPPLGMGMTATEPGGSTLNAAEVNAGEQLLGDGESLRTRKDEQDAAGLLLRYAPSLLTPPIPAEGGDIAYCQW